MRRKNLPMNTCRAQGRHTSPRRIGWATRVARLFAGALMWPVARCKPVSSRRLLPGLCPGCVCGQGTFFFT